MYDGAKLYNEVPNNNNIKQSGNLNIFKKFCDEFVKM